MTKASASVILDVHEIERHILVVRGQRVLLDSDLGRVLRRMMEPPPEPARRKIGFHTSIDAQHSSNGRPRSGARI